MVKGLLNILHREFSGLHETAFLLAGSSLLSQVLALFRDRLLAATFGAGTNLDIYYASFRLPDFIYVSVASFVSATVLIPFLVAKMEKNELKEAREFLSAAFNVFMVVMLAVTTVAFVAAPFLSHLIAPGFNELARQKLILLTRILLLSPILLGLSHLFGSVTQAYKKFLVYSLSPVLYNLGIIFGVTFLYPFMGLGGLAWGAVVGAGLHFSIQISVLWETGFWPKFRLSLIKDHLKELTRVFFISLPRTIVLSFQQISSLVLIAFASFMNNGSIAIFSFSMNLQSVPLSIIGVSYSVAAFPTLAKLFTNGQKDVFLKQVTTAARHIIFWSMPATVLFIVLRAQIVRVILGAGRFDWSATRLTAATLALFALSIYAQSLIALFARSYYATGKNLKPLLTNLLSSGLMIVFVFLFNFLFTKVFFFRFFLESILRVDDLPGTAVLVLPLAFSLAMIINLAVLWWLFNREFERQAETIINTFWQSFAASVIGGFAAYNCLNLIALFGRGEIDTFFAVFFQGLAAGLAGLLTILAMLWLMGSRELAELFTSLRKKIWRPIPVVPDQPEL